MSDTNPLNSLLNNPLTGALTSFVQGWSKLNADSMRRYFEIQGEGMQAYADANRALLEALRDAKSLPDAAAAQQAFFDAIQQNASAGLAKQVDLARQVGQDSQELFAGLVKRD